MQMFLGGRLAGDHLVLAVTRFLRREAGVEVLVSLIGVDETGRQIATYLTRSETNEFANLVIDERKSPMNALVWDVDTDGRVYISDEFGAYRINVWQGNGTRERVIEREYESRVRTEEEMKHYAPRAIIRRGGRSVQPEVRTSKTDRDIVQIFERGDGTTWVVSSRGAFDAPEGAIATFDVFDQSGRFTRQVTLIGEGRFRDDGFHMVNDRLYVVTGLRSARQAMFGGGEVSGGEETDEKPMSVICYDLSPIIQSQK